MKKKCKNLSQPPSQSLRRLQKSKRKLPLNSKNKLDFQRRMQRGWLLLSKQSFQSVILATNMSRHLSISTQLSLMSRIDKWEAKLSVNSWTLSMMTWAWTACSNLRLLIHLSTQRSPFCQTMKVFWRPSLIAIPQCLSTTLSTWSNFPLLSLWTKASLYSTQSFKVHLATTHDNSTVTLRTLCLRAKTRITMRDLERTRFI